jgi:hypothetical protein
MIYDPMQRQSIITHAQGASFHNEHTQAATTLCLLQAGCVDATCPPWNLDSGYVRLPCYSWHLARYVAYHYCSTTSEKNHLRWREYFPQKASIGLRPAVQYLTPRSSETCWEVPTWPTRGTSANSSSTENWILFWNWSNVQDQLHTR